MKGNGQGAHFRRVHPGSETAGQNNQIAVYAQIPQMALFATICFPLTADSRKRRVCEKNRAIGRGSCAACASRANRGTRGSRDSRE